MGKRIGEKRQGTKTSRFGTTSRINHDSSAFYNSQLYSELPNNNTPAIKDNVFPVKLMNDPAAEQRGITGIFSIRPKGRGTNPIEIRYFNLWNFREYVKNTGQFPAFNDYFSPL